MRTLGGKSRCRPPSSTKRDSGYHNPSTTRRPHQKHNRRAGESNTAEPKEARSRCDLYTSRRSRGRHPQTPLVPNGNSNETSYPHSSSRGEQTYQPVHPVEADVQAFERHQGYRVPYTCPCITSSNPCRLFRCLNRTREYSHYFGYDSRRYFNGVVTNQYGKGTSVDYL